MKEEMILEEKFWRKRIPLLPSLLIVVAGILFFVFSQFHLFSGDNKKNTTPALMPAVAAQPSETTRYRMNDFMFTHPLMLVDQSSEASELINLKAEIEGVINAAKAQGAITSASVYINRLNNDHWISINGNEGYNGGSLLKVPVMMTYLREAEKRPGLLGRKLVFSYGGKVPQQTFNEGNIEQGKSYTIKELMYYMIARSDNYATSLLNKNINTEAYENLFADIGIPKPNMTDRSYTLTVNDYSKFLRVLYNATYLNIEDADFALSLLSQVTFKEGLTRELPASVKVAHKFGEWGEPVAGTLHQLHESGIVYCDGNPYLITVMTKGKEVKPLPDVISQISKLVFDSLAGDKPKS